MKKLVLALWLCVCLTSFAHKPELVSEYGVESILVENPEVSKAYYGVFDFATRSQEFVVDSEDEFELYANFLLPINEKSLMDKRMTMQIFRGDELLVDLSGREYEWGEFFEPFGYDNYLMGPEFEKVVSAGVYRIVLSMDEDVEFLEREANSYSVAIGKIEDFGLAETLDTYRLIPKIKSQIFAKSGADFVLSPLGGFLLLVSVLFGVLLGFVLRFFLSLFMPVSYSKKACSINKLGKYGRFILGFFILISSLFNGFSVFGFIISGIVFFEAFFNYCFFKPISNLRKL